LKFPESLILADVDPLKRGTYEKLAFEEPRLKPTVPYALTISKMTLKMLNHGSSALPIIRVRYFVSLIIRFVHALALTSMIQMSQRERASHHMSKASWRRALQCQDDLQKKRKYVLPTNIAHDRFRIGVVLAFDFGI
jgi:hypothetical protein